MKIKYNNDNFYYKCIPLLGVLLLPIFLAGLISEKEYITTIFVYILIGIPIIYLTSFIFSKLIIGEKNYIEIYDEKVIIWKKNRFESDNNVFSIYDIKISYKNILCLESIVFDSSHPEIIHRYAFSKNDYNEFIKLVKHKSGENIYEKYTLKDKGIMLIMICLSIGVNIIGIKLFFN